MTCPECEGIEIVPFSKCDTPILIVLKNYLFGKAMPYFCPKCKTCYGVGNAKIVLGFANPFDGDWITYEDICGNEDS